MVAHNPESARNPAAISPAQALLDSFDQQTRATVYNPRLREHDWANMTPEGAEGILISARRRDTIGDINDTIYVAEDEARATGIESIDVRRRDMNYKSHPEAGRMTIATLTLSKIPIFEGRSPFASDEYYIEKHGDDLIIREKSRSRVLNAICNAAYKAGSLESRRTSNPEFRRSVFPHEVEALLYLVATGEPESRRED